MRKRYGDERWRTAACGIMGALLSLALVGTAPLAFAEGSADDGGDAGSLEEGNGGAGSDEELIGSAFKLGDVTVTCKAQDEGSATPLSVGVPVERTYLLTNEGERAYVRLASSLMFGHLEQANEAGVTESSSGSADTEAAEVADAEGGEDATAPAWRLADDGWWYRSQPLEAGETIAVHIMVEVPFDDAWVGAFSTGEPSSIREEMNVEAVQARNMSIDPNAERPWGGLDAEFPDDEPASEEVEA